MISYEGTGSRDLVPVMTLFTVIVDGRTDYLIDRPEASSLVSRTFPAFESCLDYVYYGLGESCTWRLDIAATQDVKSSEANTNTSCI